MPSAVTLSAPARARPGPGRPGRAAGFTLIELLVVLVVIGCLVGLASFSSGKNVQRELADEAQRLATLIALLADEAVLDNQEYGLLFTASGYRVLAYDEQHSRWLPSGNDAEYRLADNLRLRLELEGSALHLPASPTAAAEPGLGREEQSRAAGVQPQLLILSSGEWSAFRLRVEEAQPQGQALELSSDGFQLPQLQAQAR